MTLGANSTHEIALLAEGYQLGEAQVVAANWSGETTTQHADVKVTLEKLVPDKKAKQLVPAELPVQPTAVHAASSRSGSGPIKIESTPSDAEAFLFIGITGSMRFSNLTAGRDYELVVAKPGYKPRHLTIKADEWRDGGDPNIPIDRAKKKGILTRSVELEELPKGK
jgi:hypothetical protein